MFDALEVGFLWLGQALCKWFGHTRDWPEQETCARCGTVMPLEDAIDDRD